MPLGKNLDNILGEYFGEQGIDLTSSNTQIVEIEIAKIQRNPHQTRKHFEADKITSLAQNIDKNGLINPITVLKDDKGQYILLAGERRLRAYQELGKTKIPCIIKDFKKLTTNDKFLISASENLQRENLNPIELAKTFQILMDTHGWSLRAMGRSIGMSGQYVLNYTNLLQLSDAVQEAVAKKTIGEAHARRLTPLPHSKQDELLARIIAENISIRELSDIVNRLLEKKDFKIQAVNSSWINRLPPKQFAVIEEWTKQFPKSQIKAKGDQKKGKIVISWGGHRD
jgi:ParB family transcriptional regulator, chromosome partitioning protein